MPVEIGYGGADDEMETDAVAVWVITTVVVVPLMVAVTVSVEVETPAVDGAPMLPYETVSVYTTVEYTVCAGAQVPSDVVAYTVDGGRVAHEEPPVVIGPTGEVEGDG